MKIIATILFSILHLSLVLGQSYSGFVYEDKNADQQFDAGDRALSGVKVSDGYSVVTTGENGRFTLQAHPQSRFLFVTTPAGYKHVGSFYLPLDRDQTEQQNFGLVKDTLQQSDQLDFIQVTDTETATYGPWIDNVRQYAANNSIPLIMHTGDICYEEGMKMHAQHVNTALMGRSVRYAVGNHDLVKGKYGEQLFEAFFGPTYYSFETGPAYFVVTPMWSGDYAPSYTKDQVIAWLKKDLALKDKDKPLIFINHDFNVGPDFVLSGTHEELDLKQYNLKAWLFGHWHNNYVFKNQDYGVTVISTNAPNKGGIDHAAGQFLHISLRKDGVHQIRPVYSNLRNRIHLIDPVFSDGNIQLLANVYDSERRARQVNVTGLDEKRNVVFETSLVPQTDWSWTGHAPLNSEKTVMSVLVEAQYANGEYEIRKRTIMQHPEQGFRLNWVQNIGASIWKGGPLLVDDLLITASIDDGANGRSTITAIHKGTGQIAWSYKTKNSVKQKLNSAKDLVLATDVSGTVYALDVRTGQVIWTKDLSGGKLPNYVSRGTLFEGVYYTGFGGYLCALDAVSGKELWRNKDWNRGEATPVELLATDQFLFTGANWNAFFVHDRKTGKLRWKKSEDGIRFRSGGVAVEGQEVYVSGQNTMSVFDTKTGKRIRQEEYDQAFMVMATPLLLADQLIMPNAAVGVSGYDKETLERIWNFKTGEAMIYSSPYTTPDQRRLVATVESTVQAYKGGLVFGASDGYIYFLDQKGNLLDRFYLGAPILADIQVDGEELYLSDFAGNVYHFSYNGKLPL